MTEPTYLLMSDTEMQVFHAASRIYSAMIQSNLVSEDNKKAAMEKAVADAVELAEIADKKVTCPDEHPDRRRSRDRGRTF